MFAVDVKAWLPDLSQVSLQYSSRHGSGELN